MLGRAEPSFPWQTNLRRPCVAEHAEEASISTPRLMRVVFDRFKTTTAAATGFVLTLLISTGKPARALTGDEETALRALCRAGLKANGGIWASERINAASATLAFGRDWPDDAQATAYKTCNTRGYLN